MRISTHNYRRPTKIRRTAEKRDEEFLHLMKNLGVDPSTKREAIQIFSRSGFSARTAIRAFIIESVKRDRLPFDLTPNEETQSAIQEVREGRGKRFNSVEALFDDLNADD